MPKVTVVQVVYNNKRFMEPVFSAIFNQTYKDIHVVAVISGNSDGGKEYLQEKFPQVEIINPGFNIGFAAGHNLVFEKYNSEFFQLVNPDLVLEPDYIEKMMKVFEDEKVGGATGKLLQIGDCELRITDLRAQKSKKIDTTGVVIEKSGRARDRGQHEVDNGQYDELTEVQAVSGAGPMYRREALESVRGPRLDVQVELKPSTYNLEPASEYFDSDFHSYWEDVDLSWRMAHKGWKNVFVPEAVGYHGRGAGSSKNGYFHVVDFIKHHKQLPERIRKLNYQNHIFLYVKNSPYIYPQFLIREFFMFFYIVCFEISTLSILPHMIALFPRMWQKRKLIFTK